MQVTAEVPDVGVHGALRDDASRCPSRTTGSGSTHYKSERIETTGRSLRSEPKSVKPESRLATQRYRGGVSSIQGRQCGSRHRRTPETSC
jgi:hypothetical protein